MAAGDGRRPASHVRNVSTATPSAVAHSAWHKWRRVRISLKAEALLAIGHDDAIGPPQIGSEWIALDCQLPLQPDSTLGRFSGPAQVWDTTP